MFVHNTFIIPEHHVPLESAIRNHMGITSHVLAKLYKSALANLEAPYYEASQFNSHLKSGNVAIGTSTDSKSGVFVQLARADGNPRLLLTVGMKWAMEQPNPTQGNIATTLW
jgi:hypothetical protein